MRFTIIILSLCFLFSLAKNQQKRNLSLRLAPELEKIKNNFFKSRINDDDTARNKRSETISSQTVYQFQKKQRKCKNLRSYGIASGGNALSYMSFVASVITLVLNINNNINANNNNNNQVCFISALAFKVDLIFFFAGKHQLWQQQQPGVKLESECWKQLQSDVSSG